MAATGTSIMKLLRVGVQDREGEGGGHWHRLLVPPVHKLKG